MKKSILIISIIFLFASCATTHMAKPDKAPNLSFHPDKATLVIIREAWLGGAIVFWNYLDGKLIGETQTKTYFLGEGVTMGLWRARTSGFYPMTPEDATKAMKNCSYLEYNPKTGQEDMDPQLYQQAIDEYLKDIKDNPDAFKDILNYDGVVMK